MTTSKSVGYYWTNVKTGDGGVPLPKDVSIEYLNADSGQYETVPNLKVDKTFPADDELDATNPVYGPYTYTFDQVTTKSMKLVVNKKANDNKVLPSLSGRCLVPALHYQWIRATQVLS